MTRGSSTRGVLLAALLLVIAGCAGSGPPAATDGVDTTAEPTATADPATPTPTRSPTAAWTASPTPTPVPVANPWRKAPIVIGLNRSADPERNYTSSVIRAVAYWNENAAGQTAWDPAFVVAPDHGSPDIEIRFVDEIPSCGAVSDGITIGCAPLLEADAAVDGTVVVRVNAGLTNDSTYRVVRHELGHVLGLDHDEGPGDVMAPYDRVYDRIVRVHLAFETSATHEHRDTRRQVGYALDYYADGAEGHVREEVEFAVIEDREAADIHIEVNRRGDDSRFNGTADGQARIELNGIGVDRRGWHVGYWLGFYLGAADVSELPPPFDEPDSDPRENWWH